MPDLALEHLAGGAIDGDDVAALDGDVARHHLAAHRIDLQHARAGDAGPAHAARHHGGVAGHAAARGQDAARRMHAVNVFRAGFGAHQDHVTMIGGQLLGFLGGEGDFAGGGARRGAQADRDLFARRIGIQGGMQQAGSSASGSTRVTAIFLSISPSRSMSTAAFSAASAVRLPERVCSMKSLPSCTVNSTSCMSR